MSRHAATRIRPANRMTAVPPQLRTAAGATAAVSLLGLALGALAWTRPVATMSAITMTLDRSMTFSYTATVPETAAYDGTTVTSPDPIFRKLTNTVKIRYAYRGAPGRVAVAARLSTPSGWHSNVPLAAPVTFTTNRYDGTVELDLNALDARAQAAAKATGIPTGQVAITVTPTIRTTTGNAFTPALPLTLTPLQLTLTGGHNALTVTDASSSNHRVRIDRTLGVAGHRITVATARRISAGALLFALLAVALLALLGRRFAPVSEGAGIRSRYAPLLVPVTPMSAPPGHPVVDVDEFATLARIAERYGLLVLHWTRSGVDTFVVQDEATTYRYRSGDGDTTPDTDTSPDGHGKVLAQSRPDRPVNVSA